MSRVKYIGGVAVDGHIVKATVKGIDVRMEHIKNKIVQSTKTMGLYEFDMMLCKTPNGADQLRYVLYTNFGVYVHV